MLAGFYTGKFCLLVYSEEKWMFLLGKLAGKMVFIPIVL